jgi:hypothetical protein
MYHCDAWLIPYPHVLCCTIENDRFNKKLIQEVERKLQIKVEETIIEGREKVER